MISFHEQFQDSVYKPGEPYVVIRLGALVLLDDYNPLAAMCNYRDSHSTERLPASTAKEAPHGICAVAGFDHRPGAWK